LAKAMVKFLVSHPPLPSMYSYVALLDAGSSNPETPPDSGPSSGLQAPFGFANFGVRAFCSFLVSGYSQEMQHH